MEEGSRALQCGAPMPLSHTANLGGAWLLPKRNQIAARFPFVGGVLEERIFEREVAGESEVLTARVEPKADLFVGDITMWHRTSSGLRSFLIATCPRSSTHAKGYKE
jgi:hypothetical protein